MLGINCDTIIYGKNETLFAIQVGVFGLANCVGLKQRISHRLQQYVVTIWIYGRLREMQYTDKYFLGG